MTTFIEKIRATTKAAKDVWNNDGSMFSHNKPITPMAQGEQKEITL